MPLLNLLNLHLKDAGVDVSNYLTDSDNELNQFVLLLSGLSEEIAYYKRENIDVIYPDFSSIPEAYEDLSKLDKNRFLSKNTKGSSYMRMLIMKQIMAINIFKKKKEFKTKILRINEYNHEVYDFEWVCRFLSFLRASDYIDCVDSPFNPESDTSFLMEPTVTINVDDVYQFFLNTNPNHYIKFENSGYLDIYSSGAFMKYHRHTGIDSIKELTQMIMSDMNEFIYLTRFEGINIITVNVSLISQFNVA